jgi:hypothetical protein
MLEHFPDLWKPGSLGKIVSPQYSRLKARGNLVANATDWLKPQNGLSLAILQRVLPYISG